MTGEITMEYVTLEKLIEELDLDIVHGSDQYKR